jgi:signal peptidase II
LRSDSPVKAFILAAMAVALDQATKALAFSNLSPVEPVPVLGDFFRLVLKFNEGAAFSLSWGGTNVLIGMTAIAAVAVTVAILRWRRRSPAGMAGLGFILGGALGNLGDRVLRDGRVIDFLDMGLGTRRWPTFNVADIAITVGALMLVILHRDGGKVENA